MGTLRRKSDGRYFFDQYVTVNGVRKRIRTSLHTRERSVAKLRARELEMSPRSSTSVQRISFADFQELYLRWVTPRLARDSVNNRRSTLKRLAPFIRCSWLDEFTLADADAFVLALHDEHLTGRGINYYIREIRSIFSQALTWGYVRENVWMGVKKVKAKAVKKRIVTPDEFRRFLSSLLALEPDLAPLFIFYLFTGVRRKEAVSISWEDVNFETDSIEVHGKGDRYRVVPMLPTVKRILLSIRHLPRPFALAPSTVTHKFIRIRQHAGLSGIRLHDLRKTFSTYLADHGVNSFFIQAWLGHERGSDVTESYYIGAHEDHTRLMLTNIDSTLLHFLPPDAPPQA